MGELIVGILIGMFVSFQYAYGERELRKTQQAINNSIRKDLDFYKKLSDKYEKENRSQKTSS